MTSGQASRRCRGCTSSTSTWSSSTACCCGGIPDDATSASVLRAVIDLARVGEVAIIAEGVETDEQTDWLIANGIEHAQGYLFGQPQRAEELTPELIRCLLPRGVTT